MMELKLNSGKNSDSSKEFAVMLAKILIFAITDFEDLGMPDWSAKLHEGVTDIMAKYGLQPEDIRSSKGQLLQ